jgi:hypothetical protein
MSLQAETAYAPELLIYTVKAWPSIEEQVDLRGRLIADGHLQPHTSALIDFRNVDVLPAGEHAMDNAAIVEQSAGLARRAYVVQNAAQELFLTRLRSQATHASRIGVFFVETEALKWLFTSTSSFPLTFLR